MVEITSKDNPLIKSIIKLSKSSKERKKQGLFVAEGLRLCIDAMLSGCEVYALLVTKNAVQKHQQYLSKLIKYSNSAYSVSDSIFSSISDTKTPQGVMCVIKILDKPTLFDKIKSNVKFLALENIQDPSNLGTILRTGEAVGIDGFVLSQDCCDIYSPKVVRGSMGAVFRIPYLTVDSVKNYLSAHSELASFAAVVDKSVKKITDIDFAAPCIVAVGNEGNGLKQATVNSCSDKFTIPMNGRAESLNASVAASIIMWEMIK